MDPSEAYSKAKRTLLFFVGCLFLAVFAGFKLSFSEQKISILPFQLERPELLGVIFFFLVIFFLFQFSLQWAAQRSEVQVNDFHRIDFFSISTISIISILCFLGDLIRKSEFLATFTFFHDWKIPVWIWGALGGLTALFASRLMRVAAEFWGRRLKAGIVSEEEITEALLMSQPWMLHFNPKFLEARKIITFESDGTIGEGRNDNEFAWRVRNGLLEIINSKDQVFSRFTYQPEKNRFVHTNDPDTLSIKSQLITMVTDEVKIA